MTASPRYSLLAGLLLSALPALAQDARPNVVVIMADDLGYSDIGSYGGEIRTPALDSLASGGVRFSQFYNTARCCPTRASMLTGLYPHQAGLKGQNASMNRNGATLAEHLEAAGYRTAMCGKWHLSSAAPEWQLGADHLKWLNHQVQHSPFSAPWTYPHRRGFQEHYGTIWGVVNYFDPFSLVRNMAPVLNVPKDYYATDATTDSAVQFVSRFSAEGKPFFLYLAYHAPHWPLHARPEDIARYENTYASGWDELRKSRWAGMARQGIMPAGTAPSAAVEDVPWATTGDKAWKARNMAVHAAMVDRMDQGIARLVQRLKDLGEFDNTLILFLSDNGASPERYEAPGFDRPSQLRDGTPIRYTGMPMAGPADTWGYLGPHWANAINTPFRYWKKESFEGGICTPLIAHWPKGIKAAAGSVTHQAGHVMDIVPTVLEAAGVAYPQRLGGHKLLPMEGASLLPTLAGAAPKARTLYWEHEGGRAVRVGSWKLVSLSGKPWELYNLANDRTEMNNVAAANKARADSLAALWTAWDARMARDAALPPSVELLSPKDGETWTAGAATTLRWATTGGTDITTAKLEVHDGAAWKVLADSTAHDGEHPFTVPAGATGPLRVRVTVSAGGRAYADENQATVSLAALSGSAPAPEGPWLRRSGTLLLRSPDATARDVAGKAVR